MNYKVLFLLFSLYSPVLLFSQANHHNLERMPSTIYNGNNSGKDSSIPDNIMTFNCSQDKERTPWNVQLSNHTDDNVALYFPIVAGDLDGDGRVEIITGRKYNDEYYWSDGINIYDGESLNLIKTISIPQLIYFGWGPLAIGRYPAPDGSLQGAIFALCWDYKIRSYSMQGELLNVSSTTTAPGSISLADFNSDGYPEIYIGNNIFDAATLKKLCSGGNNISGISCRGPMHDNHNCRFAMPCAVDIFGDSDLELVCGNCIYAVKINSRTDPSQNQMEIIKTITPPAGFPDEGHVALADLNQDGNLDVLVFNDLTSNNDYDNSYIYAYDPISEQILFSDKQQRMATGYPSIGDIDNDGYLEIVFLDRDTKQTGFLYVYKYRPETGLQRILRVPHDDRSGNTAMTLFDFNNDHLLEIIYRGENNLTILNATGKSHLTGNDTISFYPIYSYPMGAATGSEYPIIVDVNNDNAAEILVTGNIEYVNYLGHGHLNVISSATPWAPARKVWNQYQYQVTNINEDLTVPSQHFNNATFFTDPDTGEQRQPLNCFLQQATYLDQYGRTRTPAADIATLTNSIEIPICDNDTISITLEYLNQGNLTLTAPYKISVYANTPTPILTQTITQSIGIGEETSTTITLPVHLLQQYALPETLFFYLNDAGQGVAQSGGQQHECDISNNLITCNIHYNYSDIKHTYLSTCDGFYEWMDTIYYQSQTITETITSPNDCDTLHIIHLDIHSDVSASDSISICDSQYTWNGITYTESGSYQQVFVTPYGCDSTVYLTLNLRNGSQLSNIHGEKVIYTDEFGNFDYYVDSIPGCLGYEWFIDNPYWTLSFDHNRPQCSIDIRTTGIATLTVRAYTVCGVMENNITIHHDARPFIQIYPNPTYGETTIAMYGLSGKVVIRIYDIIGNLIDTLTLTDVHRSGTSIPYSLRNRACGMYLFDFRNEYNHFVKKVVKM